MEGPLRPVVLVQVDPLLLAQPAHLVVKLPGDLDVRGGDGSGDALGPEEPVHLGGGGEDAVAGPGPEHQPHVRLGQVEVARRQEHGGVRPGVCQQALEGQGRREDESEPSFRFILFLEWHVTADY